MVRKLTNAAFYYDKNEDAVDTALGKLVWPWLEHAG